VIEQTTSINFTVPDFLVIERTDLKCKLNNVHEIGKMDL